MSKNTLIISWVARLIVVAIFVMSVFPKLTSDPMSVSMFQTLGVDPWGRYLTAVLEAAAAVMLLIPGTVAYGAALAIVIMIGAIGAHVTKLGFEGDLASVFGMAVVVLVAASVVAVIFKKDLPIVGGQNRA